LIVYVFGSVALEVADVAQASPLPPESERIAGRRRAVSATPAQQYPRVAAASDLIAAYISTDQYLWGLHRILDGLTTSRAPLQD